MLLTNVLKLLMKIVTESVAAVTLFCANAPVLKSKRSSVKMIDFFIVQKFKFQKVINMSFHYSTVIGKVKVE